MHKIGISTALQQLTGAVMDRYAQQIVDNDYHALDHDQDVYQLNQSSTTYSLVVTGWWGEGTRTAVRRAGELYGEWYNPGVLQITAPQHGWMRDVDMDDPAAADHVVDTVESYLEDEQLLR